VKNDVTYLSMLSQALGRLAILSDLDTLLRVVAEALLRVEAVSAVEVVLFVTCPPHSSAELTLHTNGSQTPLFPTPRDNPIVDALLESGEALLTSLSDAGVESNAGITHVLASPMPAPSGPETPQGAVLGAVLLGFAGAPDLSSSCRYAIDVLARCSADRVYAILSEQERRRYVALMALIREVSEMMAQPGHGEQVFGDAIQRIQETFDLDMAAVYAGRPLTLRLQYGGRTAQPGVPVPEGLAQQVSRSRRPMVIDDLAACQDHRIPHWAPNGTRSEVAIPLQYQNRHIGVLDLFSSRPAALDHVDLEILATISHQLAILIVQERWDNQNYTSEQLRQAYDRLQELTELKDQILQNVSHELRTPLTLIKGYIELVMTGQMGELLSDQRQSLQVVLRKADEVVRIVEQMVALTPPSRPSVVQQRISIKALFTEMAEVFARRTEGSPITWDFHVAGDDLYLSGDIDKIRQICYSILDNSVKFSPDGGCISVHAASEQAYVHLIFEDEGVGIPQPRLTQIFETFYQVDGSSTRQFGGLGLGLAVANRAVVAHNGKVWAESELGKGSVFHVLLPKYEPTRRVLNPTGHMNS
jgi:signal transduction histidine kinase